MLHKRCRSAEYRISCKNSQRVSVAVWQKNRELEAEAAASKKREAGEYDLVVRQLQFEMKAKVCKFLALFWYVCILRLGIFTPSMCTLQRM